MRSTRKAEETQGSDDRKRALIASIEALREQGRQPVSALCALVPAVSKPVDELQTLRDELRSSRATCALLEEETKRLEQKTLRAIAEAGELRRMLDAMQGNEVASAGLDLIGEREKLRRAIREAEEERGLLTRALSDSETEISRLGKTIELLVRKMAIAC